jgi:hypothetical protein
MRAIRPLFVLITVVSLAAPPVAAATTVSDPHRGFSFVLPDGFAENPGSTRTPKLNLVFGRGELGTPGGNVLQVASMGGTIGHGKLDPALVEKAARDSVRGTGVALTKFEYRKTTWKGFALDLLVTHAQREGQAILTLSTQVPIAKEAIQITLAGPAGEAARLLADFQAVLGSLEGKSNWLTDDERSERLGRIVGVVVGLGLGVALVVYLLRRRQRRSPGHAPGKA